MRIAFIVSCLEPQKDGVGDYTRDLAAACVAQGASCRALALNDRYVDVSTACWQSARGIKIETLRLPASQPWRERLLTARAWLQQQTLEWISLQFVPYGFHPKGLVIGLDQRLAPLVAGCRLHVMFHELWIGLHGAAGSRERLIGWIQRRSVASLVARLKPDVIHTSNGAYVDALSKRRIRAKLLPLCGSIPIAADADHGWLGRELLKLGVPTPRVSSRHNSWWFGLFGALHPAWSPEPLFTYIAEAAQRAGRAIVVISIGRVGPGEARWRDIQARYSDRFCFAKLGEHGTREVSAFLQAVDFGIATSPWQLIGKSASAAAMLDHGLPIIVSRDEVDLGNQPVGAHDPLLYRMDETLPQWLLSVRRRAPRDRLAEIAERFSSDLRMA